VNEQKLTSYPDIIEKTSNTASAEMKNCDKDLHFKVLLPKTAFLARHCHDFGK
jgi:hypothetical protein